MQNEEIDIDALEKARCMPRKDHPKGHTVEEACEEIGITVQTWYGWQRRAVVCPRARTLASVKRYIKGAS